jgi:hypothetical protein
VFQTETQRRKKILNREGRGRGIGIRSIIERRIRTYKSRMR